MEEGHYHFSSQLIKRSQGHSSVAGAAYRSGECLTDERTGEMHDFTRRGGVEHSEILTPDGCHDWMSDRETLWNHVEVSEKRKDAQVAREINFGLPHQLNDDQRLELVREFLSDTFVAEGMIADFAIHKPQKEKGDDARNYHAHVMLSLRIAGKKGFYRVKTREWNSQNMLKHWRAQWATFANEALANAGQKVKLDHRSHKDRGIDQEPQIHIGRKRRAMADKELEPRERPLNRKEKSYLSLLAQAPPHQARWMNHPQSPWAKTRRSLMYKKQDMGDRMFRNYQILESVRRGFSMKEKGLRGQMSSARQTKFNTVRAHKRALFNMRNVFDMAYKNPSDARVKFQGMVDAIGFEKAYAKLLNNPSSLGTRKGSGIFGAWPFSADKERQAADQALKFLGHRFKVAQETARDADEMTHAVNGIKYELDKINRKNRAQSERQKKLDRRYNAAQLNPARSRGDSHYNRSPMADKIRFDTEERITNATLDGKYHEAQALRDNAATYRQSYLSNTKQGRTAEKANRKHETQQRLNHARKRDRE